MNFNSSDYLPNTEKRLNHLRKIIAGRPVAILAAGPSIYELEKRIGELSQADICYFGINTFFVQENNILKKIKKKISVLIEATLIKSDEDMLPTIFDEVVSFLNRNDDNMLISSLADLRQFFDKYNEKLLSPCYVTDRTVPDNDRPLHLINGNSLSGLIYLAIIGNASKIVLFGADGGYAEKNTGETYYRSKKYYPTKKEGAELQQRLVCNTNKGFNPIVLISLMNIYKTYNIEPAPILNCSEVSFLTPFPKVSYNDAFALLLGKKTAEEIKDLRIPTASIIIPSDENGAKLQNTLNNISQQIYSNYETIVVEKGSDLLDIMKKALSLAKGKYIFYCPAGHTYLNRSWINSCLEVLENRPQISLVCGIPEDQLAVPPWKKRKFIYYWLKKKIFFPPSAMCVRRTVLEKCLLSTDGNQKTDTELENWLNFNLCFNIAGYLPVFIPMTAGSRPKEDPELLKNYKRKIDSYKYRLILGKTSHHFRDGDGNILPGKFYLSMLIFFDLAKKISAKSPKFLRPIFNAAEQTIRRFYPK